MGRHFSRKYGHSVWLAVFGLTLLCVDFFTKAFFYNVLPRNGFVYPVFHQFFGIDFSLSLAFNRGAAWGVFSNFQFMLLIMRMAVILGMLVYLTFIKHNRKSDLPLILITAGALGNVLDFFLYGYVIDFLQFNLWGYDFPVFNFADTWITLGVSWLFLVTIFTRKTKRHASRL